MRARFVYENIEFERGRNPRKSMDIGVAVENRNPERMKANFENAFPMFRGHTGSLHGAKGDWTTYTASARNPKDGLEIEDRKEDILDWFNKYTDYDVVKWESGFDRRFHPWGDPKNPLEWDQQFTVHLGYNENIRESYNFERGQDPKSAMEIGKASKPNYFRDNLEGISYKEWMKNVSPGWPWGQGEEILKEASRMLGVPEGEVLIAVEYDDDPLTTSVIEQIDEDHEWTYSDEGETEDFDLIGASTGEIYVVHRDEGVHYLILGTDF